MLQKIPVRSTEPYCTEDGHRIPVEITSSHFIGPDARRMLIAIFRDITERKPEGEGLHRIEETFQHVRKLVAKEYCAKASSSKRRWTTSPMVSRHAIVSAILCCSIARRENGTELTHSNCPPISGLPITISSALMA